MVKFQDAATLEPVQRDIWWISCGFRFVGRSVGRSLQASRKGFSCCLFVFWAPRKKIRNPCWLVKQKIGKKSTGGRDVSYIASYLFILWSRVAEGFPAALTPCGKYRKRQKAKKRRKKKVFVTVDSFVLSPSPDVVGV